MLLAASGDLLAFLSKNINLRERRGGCLQLAFDRSIDSKNLIIIKIIKVRYMILSKNASKTRLAASSHFSRLNPSHASCKQP